MDETREARDYLQKLRMDCWAVFSMTMDVVEVDAR